jgi:hypothetical protein
MRPSRRPALETRSSSQRGRGGRIVLLDSSASNRRSSRPAAMAPGVIDDVARVAPRNPSIRCICN